MNNLFLKKRGTALVYGLVIIVAASVIFAGLIKFVTEHFRYSFHAEPRQQALHIAESGVYFYRWYLGHNIDGKTSEEVSNFWATGNPLGVDDDGNGECSESEYYETDYDGTNAIGKYQICVTKPNIGATDAEILATGWTYKEPDVKRSVRVRMRRPAWSEFVLLSDSDLEIENKTTFYGAVHANDGIEFNGTAYGDVSSSVESYLDENSQLRDGIWSQTGQGIFYGAKTFPAPVQDFNSIVVSFAEIAAAAQGQYELPTLAGGQGWHIVLKDNGEADVYWVKKYHKTTKEIVKEELKQVITLDSTSAIYLRNDLWIDGTLDAGKQLTIAAHHNGGGRDQDIYINGDIVYENYNSMTILGLATERNINTVKNPNVAGDGDNNSVLEIDAAMLAQTGFVGRSNYGTATSDKIDMDFYGAIATKQGLLQESVDVSTLTYDPKFLITAPPYFPTGSSYVIDQWTEMD